MCKSTKSSRCLPVPLSIGQTNSLTFGEIAVVHNDQFRVFVTIGTNNPDGAHVSGAELFSIVYEGHLQGAKLLCEPSDPTTTDELVVHIFHAWTSRISSVDEIVGTKEAFAPTDDAATGRTTKDEINIGGQDVASFGPYASPVAIGQQIRHLQATVSNPMTEDNTYVSRFEARSPVAYHMDDGPIYQQRCQKPGD